MEENEKFIQLHDLCSFLGIGHQSDDQYIYLSAEVGRFKELILIDDIDELLIDLSHEVLRCLDFLWSDN